VERVGDQLVQEQVWKEGVNRMTRELPKCKVGDIVLVQFNPPGTHKEEDGENVMEIHRTFAVVAEIFPTPGGYGMQYIPDYSFYFPPIKAGEYTYGGLDKPYPEYGWYMIFLHGPFDATHEVYQLMSLDERRFIKAARKKLGLMERIDRMFWKGDDGVYRSEDGYETDGVGCEVRPPKEKLDGKH